MPLVMVSVMSLENPPFSRVETHNFPRELTKVSGAREDPADPSLGKARTRTPATTRGVNFQTNALTPAMGIFTGISSSDDISG